MSTVYLTSTQVNFDTLFQTLPPSAKMATSSEAPVESTQQYQMVSAAYQSPNNAPFTWKKKTATPPSDKTAYLRTLQEATAKMQDHINAELTARMEEDKALEASSTHGAAKAKGVVDEAKEEDNYGEEVVEED